MSVQPLNSFEIDGHINAIADALYQGQCRLFIGAGLPASEAGLPSTRKLASLLVADLIRSGRFPWAKELLEKNQLKEEIPLSMIAELYGRGRHREELLRFVEQQLSAPRISGPSYQALYDLAMEDTQDRKRLLLEYLYTTNYDKSIEDYLASKSLSIASVTTANQRSLVGISTTRVRVIHLHGVVGGRSDDWVITDEDELRELTETESETLLKQQLKQDLGTKVLVFIGYSLRDTTVKLMHYIVDSYSKSSQQMHYAMVPVNPLKSEEVPSPSTVARWYMYREVWRERKMELLDLTSDEFFARLKNALVFRKCEDAFEELSIETGREVDELKIMVDNLIEEFSLTSCLQAIQILKANL